MNNTNENNNKIYVSENANVIVDGFRKHNFKNGVCTKSMPIEELWQKLDSLSERIKALET